MNTPLDLRTIEDSTFPGRQERQRAILQKKPKILFFSTGDATRSQIAAVFFRTLAGDGFDVLSTAVQPNSLHPLTRDVMREAGVDIADQSSSSVAESLKESFTCVVTICDAARERHPVFPFTTRLVHWSVADPANAQGSLEQRLEVLRRLRDRIKQQVSQFIAQMGQAGQGTLFSFDQRARAATANGTTWEDKKEQ